MQSKDTELKPLAIKHGTLAEWEDSDKNPDDIVFLTDVEEIRAHGKSYGGDKIWKLNKETGGIHTQYSVEDYANLHYTVYNDETLWYCYDRSGNPIEFQKDQIIQLKDSDGVILQVTILEAVLTSWGDIYYRISPELDKNKTYIYGPYKSEIVNQANGYASVAEGFNTKAENDNSHTEGQNTISSGKAAHAEGDRANATGFASHAEGISTISSGNATHTEGYGTMASNDYSHAEGDDTEASGRVSHAEGYMTKALGEYSHSEGSTTTGTGQASHAEGAYTTAAGLGSHSEGGGTKASGYTSHAEGGSTVAEGYCAHAEGSYTTAYGSYSHAEGSGASSSLTGYNWLLNSQCIYFNSSQWFGIGVVLKIENREEIIFVKVTDISDDRRFITVDKEINLEYNNSNLSVVYGVAYGDYSHAEGSYNTASGDYSHVEGSATTGTGNYSHVEGSASTGIGFVSHAEGGMTMASGEYSHAEGRNTIASGYCSHAEGCVTKAERSYSHAEGSYAKASGYCSHAEGDNTTASGQYSHAEGSSTVASSDRSHAEGLRTKATGTCSHAEGCSTTSSSACSHAEGSATTGCGAYSHAEGCLTKAEGQASHSEGFESEATGSCAHAEGSMTVASGDYSHAEGEETVASGYASHAEGDDTEASGDYSHAEGSGTTGTGDYSHAEGDNTTASGQASHAEGYNTKANGWVSHAEGSYTDAAGSASHSEGDNTTASGRASHSEGDNTTASGQASHAEGYNTTASGYASHAEGYETEANNHYEHAQGQYNISNKNSDEFGDELNTIHSIGIGGYEKRKNAQEVMQNGDYYVIGIGGYDGTNPKEATRLQDVVAEHPKVQNELTYSDDGQTLTSHPLLYNDMLVVDTEEDYNKCTEIINQSSSEILKSWTVFGSGSVDKNAWGYCSSNSNSSTMSVNTVGGNSESVPVFRINEQPQDYIFNVNNTGSLTGYYSPEKFANYDYVITTGIIPSLQDGGYQDYQAIILALSCDNQSKNAYGISLYAENQSDYVSGRGGDDTVGNKTIKVIAWKQGDLNVANYQEKTILTYAEGLQIIPYNSDLNNSSGVKNTKSSCIQLRTIRQGNILKVYSSKPYRVQDENGEWADDSKYSVEEDLPITIDLLNYKLSYKYYDNDNNIVTVNKDFSNEQIVKDVFDKLRGAAYFGYEAESNPGTFFRYVSGFNNNKIINVVGNNYQIESFNPQTSKFEPTSEAVINQLKNGSRLAYNRITKKLFYFDGYNFIHVATVKDDTMNAIESKIAELDSKVDSINTQVSNSGVPKGTVIDWYGDASFDNIPYGWVPCGGFFKTSTAGNTGHTPNDVIEESNKWVARYPGMQFVYRHSSDGSNTYCGLFISKVNDVFIPNLSGRFIVGAGINGNTNISDYTVKSIGGQEEVTLTAAQSGLPEHTHPVTAKTNTPVAIWGDGDGSLAGATNGYLDIVNVSGTATENQTKDALLAHENRPPYYALWKLIKVI